VPYDPAKDFTYIIGVSDNPFGLVVRADAPWRTFREFLDHARQNPDKVTIAVPGVCSPGHLVADQILTTQGIRWSSIPYKGTADSLQALLGGHVTAAAESTGWVPFVDSGRLRLLAVFGQRRLKRFSNVPTLKEMNVDVADYSPWGIVGPSGMDPQVTRTLHDAFKKAMDAPEFVALLETLAQEPHYMSGEAYRKYAIEALPFQKSVVEKYGLKQN